MKSTSPALLVLAAGMGNRYGGLKQIDPIGPGGETLMDYSIYDALRAGFSKAVFVIRKEMEQAFRQAVGMRFERHIPVEYAFQELDKLPPGFSVPTGRKRPWGTTHAVLMASTAINEPFAVINADDFYGAEGCRALAQHLQSETADYAMVGFVLRNTLSDFGSVSRGICRVDRNDVLQSILEMTNIARHGFHIQDISPTGQITNLSGDELVSMNMWGFNPKIFGHLAVHFRRFLESKGSDLVAESFLPNTVNDLILAGEAEVKVLRTTDSWTGVTYREDRERVVETISRLIDRGDYPKRLWS